MLVKGCADTRPTYNETQSKYPTQQGIEMNEKKAKALRKSARFHPAAPREYSVAGPNTKVAPLGGQIRMFAVAGTVEALGPRCRYQDAKRSQA